MPTLSRCSRQSRKRKTLGESAASPACCRPDKAAVVSAAVQPGTERTMGGTRGPEQQLGDLCTEEEEEGFRIHVGLLLSSPFCFVSVTRASLEAARWGCGGGSRGMRCPPHRHADQVERNLRCARAVGFYLRPTPSFLLGSLPETHSLPLSLDCRPNTAVTIFIPQSPSHSCRIPATVPKPPCCGRHRPTPAASRKRKQKA